MAEITDNIIKVIATNENKVSGDSKESVSNGSIYFTQDSQNLYYDYNGNRKKVTDVIVVETMEEEQTMANNPIPNKFYFLTRSNELFYKGSGDAWFTVFPAQVDFDFGTY